MRMAIIGVYTACGLVAALLLFGWASGQTRMHFVRIETAIEIQGDKEAVWAVLADFDAYREWNPLMIEVSGQSAAGARMDWSSRLNGEVRRYNGRIDAAVVSRELTWTGPVSSFARILFWGQHSFTIEETANGTVRLVNAERFGGLATPFIRSFLQRDVRAAYETANAALKERVESLHLKTDSPG